MEDSLIQIDVRKTILSANGKVSLDIQTEFSGSGLVALYGESGAGKTTLLRMLAGLTSPDKGQIKFGDTVWFDSERRIDVPPQKRNISLMFQDYALFPNMTVEKNICFAQPETDVEEIDRLLELFGLNEFRNRKPQSLSGGQKQRVALARALARKPQLLLLDEPLSALDAGMRNVLQEEIAKIHQMSGIATVLVSHDLNEVFKLASHVIHLENGKVKCTGNPEEVFSENRISGKMQVTGQLARIDVQDNFNIVTVVVGGTQILKVIAFDDDIKNLNVGDRVIVFTKAFNPIICKLE